MHTYSSPEYQPTLALTCSFSPGRELSRLSI